MPLTIRTAGRGRLVAGRPACPAARGLARRTCPGSRSSSPRARPTRAGCSGRRSTTTTRRHLLRARLLVPAQGAGARELEPIPLGKARVVRQGTDVTVIASARSSQRALEAAEQAEAEGISRRGHRPAHPAAARRADARRVGQEDQPRRRRPRGGQRHGLRRRGRGGARRSRPSTGSTRRSSASAPASRRSPSRRRWSSSSVPQRRRRARGDTAGRWSEADGERGAGCPGSGRGMESGTIVQAGSRPRASGSTKGEPLYEVDTEKATQEVEAEASGVLLRTSRSARARCRSGRRSP